MDCAIGTSPLGSGREHATTRMQHQSRMLGEFASRLRRPGRLPEWYPSSLWVDAASPLPSARFCEEDIHCRGCAGHLSWDRCRVPAGTICGAPMPVATGAALCARATNAAERGWHLPCGTLNIADGWSMPGQPVPAAPSHERESEESSVHRSCRVARGAEQRRRKAYDAWGPRGR